MKYKVLTQYSNLKDLYSHFKIIRALIISLFLLLPVHGVANAQEDSSVAQICIDATEFVDIGMEDFITEIDHQDNLDRLSSFFDMVEDAETKNISACVNIDGEMDVEYDLEIFEELVEYDPIESFYIKYATIDPDNGEDNNNSKYVIPGGSSFKGSTFGKFSVSKSGAATYSIPIKVAPGINGLQPKLSLEYNSQSGNGILGLAWSLSGFSSIQRCARTIIHDGVKGSINFDNSDRFCLDGQRLIAVNGLYGGDNTEYRTENDSFLKITANGYDEFQVITRSGKVMLFKGIKAADGKNVRLWVVSQITDTSGNTIKMNYAEADEVSSDLNRSSSKGNGVFIDFYPDEILYANGNKVLFVYELKDRKDPIIVYQAGNEVEGTKLLSKIITYAGNKKVREYKFKYDENENIISSRLSEITECNGSFCRKPIRLNWREFESSLKLGDFSQYAGFTPKSGSWASTKPRMMADVNGDGKSDIVMFSHTGVVVGTSTGNSFIREVEKYRGFGKDTGSWGDSKPRMMADVDGDGKSDIVGFSHSGVVVALSKDKKFSTAGFEKYRYFGKDHGWKTSRPYGTGEIRMMADVNGDGRADIVGFGQTGVHIAFSAGNKFVNRFKYDRHFGSKSKAGGWSTDKHLRMMADVNGDGKADIVGFGNNGVYVSLSAGNKFVGGFSTYKGFGYDAGDWRVNKDYRQMADINGDGKADIVGIKDGKVYVAYSTGKSFTLAQTLQEDFISTDQEEDFDKDSYAVGDINGDGKIDIIGYFEDGIYALFSKGNKLSNIVEIADIPNTEDAWYRRILVDVTGDGKADVVAFGLKYVKVVSSSQGNYTQLESIIDSMGNKTSVKYKPITDNSVYTKDSIKIIAYTKSKPPHPIYSSADIYPLKDVQAPIYVVSEFNTDDGIGGTRKFSYKYAGAKVHQQGYGWLGFRWREVTDDTSKIVTKITYNQFHPYTGRILSTTKRLNGTIISLSSNSWEAKETHPKVNYPYIKFNETSLYDLSGDLISRTTTNVNQIDQYGNPEEVIVNITGDGPDSTKKIVNQYSSNSSRWILGLPTETTVTSSGTSGLESTRKTTLNYDMNTGLLKEKVEAAGSNSSLKTTYQYDTYGNVIEIKSGNNSSAERTVSYTYDNNGLFIDTVTNGLGQVETHKYDSRFGKITSLTGPNNLTTTWEYDNFGRMKWEIRPDGTRTDIRYEFLCFKKYRVVTTATGQAPVFVNKDIFNREVLRITKALNGQVLKATKYDKRGRKSQVSKYYYNNENILWTTYTYDDLNRITQVSAPGNRNTGITYNKLEVTTTNPKGQVEMKKTDFNGNMISVNDADGYQINYVYDGFNNLIETNSFGNTIRVSYNERGFKTYMEDPDLGEMYYKYNSFGELICQKDNKGQVIVNEYDKLGRMIARYDYAESVTGNSWCQLTKDSGIIESETTWEYDNAAYAVGKLTKATGSNGYIQQYVYDSKGRPQKTLTTLAGEFPVDKFNGGTFENSVTYNENTGHVDKVTYPSGFTVKYNYDDNGIMTDVLNAKNNSLYWSLSETDAYGRNTLEMYGNGLETSHTFYDATGYMKSIKTGFNGGSAVQNLTYEFDKIGNLTKRQNNNKSFIETFTYDNLNRLEDVMENGVSTLSYQYHANGNIKNKSDVDEDDYVYGANNVGPHAVTSVGDEHYTYDSNGNQISGAGRNIEYTIFNKPSRVISPSNSFEFTYGPNRKRFKQITSDFAEGDSSITYYLGNYELIRFDGGKTEERHYITVGGKQIAVYTEKKETVNNNVQITPMTRYFHTDHLGSTETITDENGAVDKTYNFGPFGAIRDKALADMFDTGTTRYGFTGHEHLKDADIIHMNGRIYDSHLGRFLNADPYIQAPFNSQSFNRYSYVVNNPLSYIDPTGYAYDDEHSPDDDDWDSEQSDYNAGSASNNQAEENNNDDNGYGSNEANRQTGNTGQLNILGVIGDILQKSKLPDKLKELHYSKLKSLQSQINKYKEDPKEVTIEGIMEAIDDIKTSIEAAMDLLSSIKTPSGLSYAQLTVSVLDVLNNFTVDNHNLSFTLESLGAGLSVAVGSPYGVIVGGLAVGYSVGKSFNQTSIGTSFQEYLETNITTSLYDFIND